MYSRAQIFDFIVGVGHWPISTAGVAKVNFFKGDIPISAFDPHIFQFGSLYSNLIPSSNFSI
eukprot:COSAG01_NODE_3475_length_6034_cov_5.161921_5_plen_61_part_01